MWSKIQTLFFFLFGYHLCSGHGIIYTEHSQIKGKKKKKPKWPSNYALNFILVYKNIYFVLVFKLPILY